jgi:hypothetical protein
VIRLLLQKAIVTVEGNTEKVKLALNWVGNYVTQYELNRPVAKYEQLSNYHQLLNRISELHSQKLWPGEIAEHLNSENWRPPKRRKTFNESMVRNLLSRITKTMYRPHARNSDQYLNGNEYWLPDLARRLKMPPVTLYSWVKRGYLNSRQLGGSQGQYILWADQSELDRLHRLRIRHRGWSDEAIPAELITPKNRKKAA